MLSKDPAMKNNFTFRYVLLAVQVIALTALLASCGPDSQKSRSQWILTEGQKDSIAFSAVHHYNVGYNFIMEADSMQLHSVPNGISLTLDYAPDSATLLKNEDFVITETYRTAESDSLNNGSATDSIWLRIGSDGIPLGWVGETEMLSKAAPVDPISHFIFQTRAHRNIILLIISILFLAGLAAIWFRQGVRSKLSGYPAALILSAATSGLLFALLQGIASHQWQEYYFHPTLNPLGQPLLLAVYLTGMWLSILLWIATIFDLYAKLSFTRLLSGMALYTVSAVFLYAALASVNIVVSVVLYLALLACLIYLAKKK